VQIIGMNAAHEPTVGQYMTRAPVTVDEGLLLGDAAERMAIDNIRHLVVLDALGHVVGVLSAGDVAVALSLPGAHGERLRVRDAMSDNPYVCGPAVPIGDVALAMEAHRWGCAIVLEGDEVVGVFTTTDALRALRELATGMVAAPAVHPTHLPPLAGTPAARRLRMRHHHPLPVARTSVFNTSG
jgi:acetoin utilization protein AcuB